MLFRFLLHNLRWKYLELWSHPWWMLGLLSLTVLFMLLFGLFISSYRVFKRRLGWGHRGLTASPMNAMILGSLAGKAVNLDSMPGLDDGGGRISKWVTRLFIAIVLQCGGLYLISQFPGMNAPFWFGVALQGFSFGSAALFYISGGDDHELRT
jgi:hypothetical protein